MDRRTNFGRRLLILGTVSAKKSNLMTACTKFVFFRMRIYAPQLLLLAYPTAFALFPTSSWCLGSWLYVYFDLIQGITDEKWKPQVTDLEWPEGSTFVHTPFAIVVQCQHKRYAEIEFGSEGFIGMIRYYKDEQIIREDIYDDRGFISSSLYYEDGQPSYRTTSMPRVFGSFVISLMVVGL